MLGFIIPVKAKSNSSHWDKDNDNLRHTLYSICNQTSDSYKVFVVYTDMPYYFENDKVVYVHYPFSYLLAHELDDYESYLKKQFSDTMGAGVFDKGKKVLWGCETAKKLGCNYLMSVDSDDLVSNRLAAFVSEHRNEKFGWYVDKGYIWKLNVPFLIKIPKNMNHLNGSTNIAHVDLLPKMDFNTKKLSDVSFYIGHGYLKQRILTQYSETLKPIPFYSIVYLIHNSNWSGYGSILKKNMFKTIAKYIIRGKIMTNKIIEEFSIPSKTTA